MLICALLLLLPAAAASHSYSSALPPSWVFAADGSIGVQVTADGGVQVSVAPTAPSSVRSNYSLGNGNSRSLQTALLPSSPLGPSTCKASGNGVVTVAGKDGISLAQAWVCTTPHPETKALVALVVTVDDVYSAGAEAVDITTTIRVDRTDVPFTAGLGMALTPQHISNTGLDQFWTTWAKGCVQNSGRSNGMCFATGPWSEPFSPEPLSETAMASYRYGGGGSNDTFALPIVTLLDKSKETNPDTNPDPHTLTLTLTLVVTLSPPQPPPLPPPLFLTQAQTLTLTQTLTPTPTRTPTPIPNPNPSP